MYFITKSSQIVNSPVKYINTQINSTHCIDFHGLTMDSAVLAKAYKQNDQKIKFDLLCYQIS
jgi:hypothetical protein